MTETGKRYGTSLYELAAEEGLTERILAELDVAVNAMQEPGYLRLLMTPSIPKKERCVLLDQAFAQAHPYLVNFLKILCEAGILPELPACARAYRDRYNQDHNILEVTAVSAVALDESARSRLQEKLQRVTGKTITATATGTVTAKSSASWCTVSVSSKTVTAKVTANSGDERTAEITISADGKETIVPVVQAGA
jgi:F-type H+-transporting ATPase subunit delta